MTGQPEIVYASVNAEPMLEVDPMLQVEPELPPNAKRPSPSVKTISSVLLKTLLLTGVLSGAFFAVTKFRISHGAEGDHVDVLNNAFVNYVGTVPGIPTAQHTAEFSGQIRFPVCDPQLVALTCETLNNETKETWHNALDARLDVVHVIEISESLMVHKRVVVQLFEKLKNDPKVRMPMILDIAGGEKAVGCMDLCRALVASYPPLEVSTHSDVGCYLNPRDTTRIQCDINLSPNVTGNTNFDIPHTDQDVAYGEETEMTNFNHPDSAERGDMKRIEARLENPNAHGQYLDNEDVNEVKMMLINRFRIWPVVPTTVQTQHVEPPAPVLDGATVATTAGAGVVGLNDVPLAPMQKLQFNSPVATTAEAGVRLVNSLVGAKDVPLAPRALLAAPLAPAGDWKKEVLRVGLEAKSNIVMSLVAMNSRKIPKVVKYWFGRNDNNVTRAEVKRVLASVHSLLNNVDFVYPGKKCGPNTYAYVFPQSPWNKNRAGKFIFYLCDTYMKVNDGEKIETLIHEGAHHLTELAKDSHWPSKGGKTMYGRKFCSAIAAKCKAGCPDDKIACENVACTKALRNADNICYFVNDAAHAAAGKVNAWDVAAYAVGTEGGEGSSFR